MQIELDENVHRMEMAEPKMTVFLADIRRAVCLVIDWQIAEAQLWREWK